MAGVKYCLDLLSTQSFFFNLALPSLIISALNLAAYVDTKNCDVSWGRYGDKFDDYGNRTLTVARKNVVRYHHLVLLLLTVTHSNNVSVSRAFNDEANYSRSFPSLIFKYHKMICVQMFQVAIAYLNNMKAIFSYYFINENRTDNLRIWNSSWQLKIFYWHEIKWHSVHESGIFNAVNTHEKHVQYTDVLL